MHCQNIRQAGWSYQDSAWTFGTVYSKWIGWHWYYRRCRRVQKGVWNCCTCQCSFHAVSHVVSVLYNQSMVWVIAIKLLCSICSGIVVSSDTKYNTPDILQVLGNKIEKCQNSYIDNDRLRADHVRGKYSSGSEYIMKELCAYVCGIIYLYVQFGTECVKNKWQQVGRGRSGDNSPHIRVSGVVLVLPWVTGIDALPIDLQPLTHVTQTLLVDGVDRAILGWSNIHQHVATTAENLGW